MNPKSSERLRHSRLPGPRGCCGLGASQPRRHLARAGTTRIHCGPPLEFSHPALYPYLPRRCRYSALPRAWPRQVLRPQDPRHRSRVRSPRGLPCAHRRSLGLAPRLHRCLCHQGDCRPDLRRPGTKAARFGHASGEPPREHLQQMRSEQRDLPRVAPQGRAPRGERAAGDSGKGPWQASTSMYRYTPRCRALCVVPALPCDRVPVLAARVPQGPPQRPRAQCASARDWLKNWLQSSAEGGHPQASPVPPCAEKVRRDPTKTR